MEVLTILVMIAAVILAAMTDAIVQRHMLSAGGGWFRSTSLTGFTGFLAATGIIATYFIVGIWSGGWRNSQFVHAA